MRVQLGYSRAQGSAPSGGWLGATLGLFVLLPRVGYAVDVEATEGRVDVYSDQWITVIAPATRGVVKATEDLSVEASYTIDILSGATKALSVDGISSATHFEEKRHEVSGDLQYRLSPESTLGVHYGLSIEPDYVSHMPSVSASTELFNRSATLSAAYSLSFETVGLATDSAYAEDILGNSLSMTWDQVLSRTTRLTTMFNVNYATCSEYLGCHASAYRYVPIFGITSTGRVTFTRSERHPDTRLRLAGSAQLAQYLGLGFALHAGYRLYTDSWDVTGHTAEFSLAKSFAGERLVLRADTRFTMQSEASFYRARYALDETTGFGPKYRTADPELTKMKDALLGVRAEYLVAAIGPVSRLAINTRIARVWYRYYDNPRLPRRDAWLVGLGLGAEF